MTNDPENSKAKTATDDLVKKTQDTQHRASVRKHMDNGGNPALIATNQTADGDISHEEREKKEEEKIARAAKLSTKIFKDNLEELNARLNELDDLIRNARDKISALDEALRTGDFEQNEDGSFKNSAVEDAIKAYEQKTGKKLDRNDIDAVITAVLWAKDQEEQNIIEWNAERGAVEKKIEDFKNDNTRENTTLSDIDIADTSKPLIKTNVDMTQCFNCAVQGIDEIKTEIELEKIEEFTFEDNIGGLNI